MNDQNPRSHRPDFAHPSTPARTSLAFVAFLISGALLGGLLGLFEMQSRAAAMALAAKPSVCPAPASPCPAGVLLASKEIP